MHQKGAWSRALRTKPREKGKELKTAVLERATRSPVVVMEGAREGILQERTGGEEPGDPPKMCGSRRCPCLHLPQPYSALDTFPLMVSRLWAWNLKNQLSGLCLGHPSTRAKDCGKPLQTILLCIAKAWGKPCILGSGKLGLQPRLFYLLSL